MALASVALMALAVISADVDSGVVRLGAATDASCTVRLSLDGGRLWPATTTIRLPGIEPATLSAQEAAALRRIIVPPGRHRLEIRAAHHHSATRDLIAPPGGELQLGEIRLRPLTVVRGTVRFRGKPVAGAAIGIAETTVGKTARDGSFEIELPEPKPPLIRVAKRSLGTKSVILPQAVSDLTLPPIEMAPAASLQVRVAGAPGRVGLVLRRSEEGQTFDVAARQLAAAESSSASFEDLDRGSYILLAAGSDPLARQATRIRIEEGERRRLTIRIEPRRVQGTVLWGDQRLPNVSLQFRHEEHGWDGRLEADEEGRFASELWQPGNYLIAVWRGKLHNTYAVHRTVTDQPITLIVPLRQIRGRVVDAASGRGIQRAEVMLRTERDTSASTVSQATDSEGSFLFDAVPAGRQRVTVSADDFLMSDPIELTVGESDPPAEVAVTLDSGLARPVRVFDHQGHPVAEAEVIAAAGNRIRARSRTGIDGRATIAVPVDPVTLYVIAPQGGFGIVDGTGSDRVDLAAPRSSLRIITRSIVGGPLPPVSFVMSIDGRVIPPVVAQRMSRLQGLSLHTDAVGEVNLKGIPAGLYQLWPYDGEVEAEAILSAPFEPPISINVKSGANVVAVDFQPALRVGR